MVDGFQIHVAALLLGAGKPLFGGVGTDGVAIEPVRTIGSPAVTHVKYRALK